MSLLERINQNQQENTPEVTPTPGLARILSVTNIEELVDSLKAISGTKTEKSLIENGERIVLEVRWPRSENVGNKIVVSVRKNAISFVGNYDNQQYIRLEQDDLSNQQLIEDSLFTVYTDPIIFRK